MSVIAPVVDLFNIPEGQPCQEASPMSGHRYFACGAPAVTIIDHGDERSYYMCYRCAMHNLRNRGASIIYSTDEVISKMMRDGTIKVKKNIKPSIALKVDAFSKAVSRSGWAKLNRWHFFREGLSLCTQAALPVDCILQDAMPAEDYCKNCQKMFEAKK